MKIMTKKNQKGVLEMQFLWKKSVITFGCGKLKILITSLKPIFVHLWNVKFSPYLFQLLYHTVFELEDLQHFSVSHLSFVLLTSRKKKKNNKTSISEPFPPVYNHLFYHNELLGESKTTFSWGPVCFNYCRPPGATHSLHSSLTPSTQPVPQASSHVSFLLLIIPLPWQTLK